MAEFGSVAFWQWTAYVCWVCLSCEVIRVKDDFALWLMVGTMIAMLITSSL